MKSRCASDISVLMISLTCLFSEGATSQERTDFLKVSQSASFVDKSVLLKVLLQPGRRFLITAPHNFGKSTNLQMIKLFLSPNSLTMKKIRNIFTNLRIYKEDESFFQNNFGKWPVLHVDFSTKIIILCLKDVVKQLKNSIHRSYMEHPYLLKSPHLDEYDKFMCNKWMTDYKEMQEYDTSVGLRNLAKYLTKHFKKPVIVLVDGYDEMIDSAMVHIGDDLLFKRVVKLISTVLENLIDSTTVKVETAIIVGVSHLSSSDLIGVKHLETFEFLEDHQFSKYFGFSLDEANIIFEQSSTSVNHLKRVETITICGGYNSKRNLTLLNPYYISQLITSGEPVTFLKHSDFLKQLLYLLKFSNIENCMDTLLSGKSFKTTIYKNISENKVIELKDLYQKKVEGVPDINLFLSHLMELGYLTYVSPSSGAQQFYEVKLPNRKIKNSLLSVYKQYYTRLYELNATDVKEKGYNEFKLLLKSYNNFTNNIAIEKCGSIWTKLKDTIKSLFSKS